MARQKYNFGFLRVAALSPPLKVGDVGYNTEKTIQFAKKASGEGADILLFPEMGLTGYTAGDLFSQRVLLDAAKEGLKKITAFSKTIPGMLVVGAPIEHEGKLFNTAVALRGGRIWGVVPKTYLPGYKEFYDERWFASARDLVAKEINLLGVSVPTGNDMLFPFKGNPEIIVGIEICEDLWTPLPPSSYQALAGANIILNPSASNELVAKAEYRRNLIAQQSAKIIAGYVYASAGVYESTTDIVFGGHSMIAENGSILKESKRFERDGEYIVADIDMEHLLHDRAKTTSFGESVHEAGLIAPSGKEPFRHIEIPVRPRIHAKLERKIDPHPFVPQNRSVRDERSKEIFSIQVAGLAKRFEYAKIKDAVIGISGGLDSTLALLVTVKAFELLKFPLKNIHCYTMPGFGTTKRTKSNAYKLCEALGVGIEEIDITAGSKVHFKDIKQDPQKQDVVFENVQARYRTMILMNKANQLHGLVIGTGDLSELALGWNTFSGDHISHYDVNSGVPKSLVKYLVQWVAETHISEKAKKVLTDILNTPISPELVRNHKKEITQKTEEIIGPYALHDFFLYHFLRWGSSPKKILYLASIAFAGTYPEKEILKWLKVFIARFFSQQWKRSVMPDGPKVGSVALSPRGDWRMPSDAEAREWLKTLKV